MKIKLSPLQTRVLSELTKPGAKAHYMDGGRHHDPYWFLSTTMEHCTKQIEILVRHGLVVIVDGGFNKITAVIAHAPGFDEPKRVTRPRKAGR